MSVVTSPILQSAVLRVVDQAELHSLCSVNIGMQACASSRFAIGLDAKNTSKGGSNAIGSNDYIVLYLLAIFKSDFSTLHIYISSLE
jgi:hypothetical protein